MSRRGRWAVPPLVYAVLLAGAGRAAAVAPEGKDEGKFFSADAIKKANEQIHELTRKTGKDLLIETYATVPTDQVEKVKSCRARSGPGSSGAGPRSASVRPW